MATCTIDAADLQPGAAVDWSDMRALYVKGLSLTELARRTGVPLGTIKARSSREKWATTVALAESHVNRIATEELADSAGRWVRRIDKAVHSGLDNVMRKGLDKLSLRDLQVALDCVEKANRIARPNYGLDRDQQARTGTLVQVNVTGGKAEVVERLGYGAGATQPDTQPLPLDAIDTQQPSN